MSSLIQADGTDLELHEEERVSGFLVADRTGVQSRELDGDQSFLVFDDARHEVLGETETVFVITDLPSTQVDVPETDVDEELVITLGRGPQGPPGSEGPQGQQGQQGPPGTDVGDIPDLVVIFENGLA